MATLADPTAVSPLTNPSHAQLHTDVNNEVRTLTGKVAELEGASGIIATNIEHARMVANTWVVSGALAAVGTTPKLLVPVIRNVTGRPVTFEAAVASALTPPQGGPIEIDIVVTATLTSDAYRLAADGGNQNSVLSQKLQIASGSTTSQVVQKGTGIDFAPNAFHAENQWVCVAITRVGSSGTTGAGLTIQLNRLL